MPFRFGLIGAGVEIGDGSAYLIGAATLACHDPQFHASLPQRRKRFEHARIHAAEMCLVQLRVVALKVSQTRIVVLSRLRSEEVNFRA